MSQLGLGRRQRRAGSLKLVLEAFCAPPKPVHLIYEAARHLPLKIRAFLDFAVPRLKQAVHALAE